MSLKRRVARHRGETFRMGLGAETRNIFSAVATLTIQMLTDHSGIRLIR